MRVLSDKPYLLTERDSNLNAAFLALLSHGKEECGKGADVLGAAQGAAWRWNGPEVSRKYPAESEIRSLNPILEPATCRCRYPAAKRIQKMDKSRIQLSGA